MVRTSHCLAIVQRLVLSSLIGCLATGGSVALSQSQAAEEPSLRSLHPWGRFSPGAWKMVRVVTETLDERGVVVSTTTHDTRTVLQSLDNESVTLEVSVTVEVGGKRFENAAQVIHQPLHGEPAAAHLRLLPAGNGSVTIEGQSIPCRIARLEFDGPGDGRKSSLTVYISDSVAPYILKRESITRDTQGPPFSETLVEVIALNLPWKILGETKTAALIRTSVRNGKGAVVTYSFVSPEVPGGVIAHTSKEIDVQGRTIRRSTLELIDYGLQCDEEPSGLFRLKRRPRLGKQ